MSQDERETVRSAPLLKDGDVVERLKQFRLRWQEDGDLTYLGKALVDAIVEIESLRVSASPAPAAGGLEAVREAAIELLSHLKLYVEEKLEPDDANMLHDRMHDLTAALASPAATSAETQGGDGVGRS